MAITAGQTVVERAARQLARWRADPRIMVREEFKVDAIDWWQEEGLLAYADPKASRLAMRACKGPGKTAWLAWIILNFLSTRPYPKIPVTAITKENLRDNLWPEISKWMRRSEFCTAAFEWTKERVVAREHPEEWFAVARAWSRDADPEQQANTLAGFHAEYLMFIIDEAGGVPDAVAAAAEGGLSVGTELKFILTGNPTHLEGPLYRAFTTESHLWKKWHVTGDPDDPKRATRVKKDWALEQIRKYGRNSAYVQVNVFGNFPEGGTDAILSMREVQDAVGRIVSAKDGRMLRIPSQIILGVDVSRYGNDVTVVCVREGDYVSRFIDWQHAPTTLTSQRVYELFLELEASEIRADDVGVGGGVVDELLQMGAPVMGINVGTKPVLDDEHHLNLRAELFLDLQNRFAEGEIGLDPSVTEDSLFVSEATTLKIGYSTGNKRKIEDKVSYRKRTGRSPNYIDSTVLAFADIVCGPSHGTSTPDVVVRRGNMSPFSDSSRMAEPVRERIWSRV